MPRPSASAAEGARILSASDAEPVLDIAALELLRTHPPGSPEDLVVELGLIFVRDMPPRLAALRDAAAAGNAAGLGAHAHAIKGCAGTFGARRLARVAEALEVLAACGALAEAVACVARVEAEFARAVACVETEILAPAGVGLPSAS
jgi:HPt (histidine-containing phosphotransfer) domain-containing protein